MAPEGCGRGGMRHDPPTLCCTDMPDCVPAAAAALGEAELLLGRMGSADAGSIRPPARRSGRDAIKSPAHDRVSLRIVSCHAIRMAIITIVTPALRFWVVSVPGCASAAGPPAAAAWALRGH
eukprot:scaffold184560_cov14-Tisochrysis_lutea.AAC.1